MSRTKPTPEPWVPRVITRSPSPDTQAADDPHDQPLLSVIVPAYNESTCIAASLLTLDAHLSSLGIDYEIIAVSDGGTDGTAEIIERVAVANSRIRAHCYRQNRGKGYAIRAGVALSRGRYVMFTDADLAIPVTIIDEFLAELNHGYDIAIASRRHPDSSALQSPPFTRQVMGAAFSWFVRRIVVSDVRDTQCGGKAYRGDVARRLFAVQRIDHFSFDAEVIYLAERAGCRIKEVPFQLHHAPSGSSIRPVRDSLKMLRDLLRIRLNAARGFYD